MTWTHNNEYVVIRHRLEVGERGDLTIWTLEPISSQHRPDEEGRTDAH